MDKAHILARLHKLKALADCGVGGERINAEKLLHRLAAAYHIDLDFLNEEEIKEFTVALNLAWQWKLFNQLTGLITHNRGKFHSVFAWNKRKRRWSPVPKHYVVKCTEAEWIEILSKFTILERDYRKQLESFYYAFLIRNDLLVERKDDKPPSQKDIDEYLAAKRLSAGINRSNLTPLLEDN